MCEKKENRVSLPSYAWSPWKEGRSKEEQRELQEIQEIRIPDGVRGAGKLYFLRMQESGDFEMTDSVKTIGGGSFTGCGALRNFICLWSRGEPLVSGMWSVKLSMKSMFPSGFGTAGREQS